MSVGVIFYQNEAGEILDIQADIIGPGKLHETESDKVKSIRIIDRISLDLFNVSMI